jgi:ceramide glucosyltransferase
MSAAAIVAYVCAGWWSLSLALYVGSVIAAFMQPAVLRRRATRMDLPPVSAIVPVNRVDPGMEAAFASLFSQAYPEFEVLVSAADESSPALAVAKGIAARYPHIPFRIVCQDTRVAVSPKLNNLVAPLAVAAHDMIFVKDSSFRLKEGELAALVRYLAPGVGLVVAPPIATRPENFAAEIECAILNGYQARLLLAASVLGVGVGAGAIMLFDRRDFERAGGVEAIAWAIGEDHALTQALRRIGLKTVIAAEEVTQVLGRRRLADVWNRQLRWMVWRRQAEPWTFYVEPFGGGLFTALAGAAGAGVLGMPAALVGAGTLAVWLALEAQLVARKGWGWSWRSVPAALCREVMMAALWIRAWTVRTIYWGDLPFEVGRRPA